MVILVALLIVLGLPLVQSNDNIKCHVCEAENSFSCANETQCSSEKQFCLLAVTRIFERFFYVSKQCTRTCPTSAILYPEAKASQPKEFLMEKPTPFLYLRCCKWALCNEKGPNTIQMFKEQLGKASERRSRYTELFLPGFMVLTANGLSALSLL
ncbi:lymphocyte antigen 6K isoform X2 [Mastomys coucha]|nr:lymphocyte antigen 6K isoform X2 [Mastomys coucha]